MNNFWQMSQEEKDRLDSAGCDWDLYSCLEYNRQDGFELSDIKQVLAVITGENDEADWHWILELNNGEFVYLVGGCDYTGWDCQSSASSTFYADPISACGDNEELKQQVMQGKNVTWHEKMDNELNTKDLPKFNHHNYPDLSEFDQ